jgi:hypothetical protein
MSVSEREDAISAVLVCPSLLRSTRPRTLTVYWPAGTPEISFGSSLVQPQACAEKAFYTFAAPPSGTHALSVRIRAGD